jgi:para-aminobenzoate synthetase / 4-amino-4-deoxychorismate lyase
MNRDFRIVLADAREGLWRDYRNPVGIITTHDPDRVLPLLREIEEKVESERFHAAGFVSYGAAAAFDPRLRASRRKGFPLLWFGLCEAPEIGELPLPGSDPDPPGWTPSITPEEYSLAIARLKDEIRQGNTYQVNYTYRLNASLAEDPWHYFLMIQRAQNAQFGAYVNTGDWSVCSASPELFFSLDWDRLTMKPMKGTASRGKGWEDDRRQADWLFQSEKNKAENRMIVDMIRNDLGKIARPGSIRVPALFSLEKYPTLWQMTSRIEARTDASQPEIWSALFPCASITGAPKRRTMDIINETETSPRGIYTGSIGYMAPGREARFNVAIRTVLINNRTGKAEYGTGGGITWDSTAEEEYEETRIKAKILIENRPDFELLETLLWTPEKGYFLLERHLDRLGKSADYFDYAYSEKEIRDRLFSLARTFPSRPTRVRLLLGRKEKITCEGTEFKAAKKWTIGLAAAPVDSANPFLCHKTTNREIYNRIRALTPGWDDVILWNERGEITESGIGNVVVRLNGRDWTPPASCGLLPGTYREELLERGLISERIILKEELDRADDIYLVNSLRKRQDLEYHKRA